MRRVGLIGITVGDAPRRIATFRHATLRVALHRYATLEPLGKPGGSSVFSAGGPPSSACGSETPYCSQPEAETEEICQRGRGLAPRRPTRRFTPGLTLVGANRLEASVQGPWTSWVLQTRQRSNVPDCRRRIQTYASRRSGRVLARCEHHMGLALRTGEALNCSEWNDGRQALRLGHHASLEQAGAQHSLSSVMPRRRSGDCLIVRRQGLKRELIRRYLDGR
jgi:hypothetical protein